MKRILGLGVAWLGATVLSVLIASAAVAGIRDRVVDTPVAIGAPTTSTTAAPASTATNAVIESTTTTAVPAPASTEAPATTTTTVVDSATSTTTTTTTASPPTTTAPPQTTTTLAMTNQTYNLVGGSVTLSFGNGEVWVVSAVANAGFDTDIEHAGPEEVEVKFESNDHKSELSARFEDGELKVEKEEEPRDGDDD